MISKLMPSLSVALAFALLAARGTSEPGAPATSSVPEELNYSRDANHRHR